MNAPLIYTHADMTLAMEGCASRVTDEVTEDVIRRVAAYIRRERDKVQDHVGDVREPLYSIGQRDALDALADEICDGEWKRSTSPSPAEPK